ncbi:MAG: SufD family Fe-S cluster assembly protein [Clostridiales bacterium]|nr:SufD family Fe-S cluster assembly protein [Clostridiales bacterium]
MDKTDLYMLDKIADLKAVPTVGAYNIRKNGQGVERRSTENIEIIPKKDKPGIDIRIKPGTKAEKVHIPVIITKEGVNDLVYNDFYIGEGADVEIVAGCGIHNSGCETSEHDGIHRFFIGKNARVKYIEKHYGEGEGTGKRILNPTTEVYMEDNSVCEMETVQIKGVDSTIRETKAYLGANARYTVLEKLMTHGNQRAESNMVVELNGKNASAQIISRSVAKDSSCQEFKPTAVGNAYCKAHVQCDSIIMDDAKISSVPAITANNADAQIVHEAAIGRINNDQLLKLMTFGMTEQEAEDVIVRGFLA